MALSGALAAALVITSKRPRVRFALVAWLLPILPYTAMLPLLGHGWDASHRAWEPLFRQKLVLLLDADAVLASSGHAAPLRRRALNDGRRRRTPPRCGLRHRGGMVRRLRRGERRRRASRRHDVAARVPRRRARSFA